MKINVAVDCTPDEARRFIGLPDVAAMHERVVKAMEERLIEAIAASDTATLVQQWMPLTLKGLEHWQSLWGQLAGAAAGRAGSSAPAGSAGAGRKRPATGRR